MLLISRVRLFERAYILRTTKNKFNFSSFYTFGKYQNKNVLFLIKRVPKGQI